KPQNAWPRSSVGSHTAILSDPQCGHFSRVFNRNNGTSRPRVHARAVTLGGSYRSTVCKNAVSACHGIRCFPPVCSWFANYFATSQKRPSDEVHKTNPFERISSKAIPNGCSRMTSVAFLSVRSPRKTGCRISDSLVHSVNFTSPTSLGISHVVAFSSFTL